MTTLIEVFSAPGCSKCAAARDALKSVAESLGNGAVTWQDLNVLEEIDHAVEMGVMSPPSIARDGELVCVHRCSNPFPLLARAGSGT